MRRQIPYCVTSTKTSGISNVIVKIVPFDKIWGKNFFEKVMFCFEKGYVFSISWGKGIVLKVKVAQLSEPEMQLKGL